MSVAHLFPFRSSSNRLRFRGRHCGFVDCPEPGDVAVFHPFRDPETQTLKLRGINADQDFFQPDCPGTDVDRIYLGHLYRDPEDDNLRARTRTKCHVPECLPCSVFVNECQNEECRREDVPVQNSLSVLLEGWGGTMLEECPVWALSVALTREDACLGGYCPGATPFGCHPTQGLDCPIDLTGTVRIGVWSTGGWVSLYGDGNAPFGWITLETLCRFTAPCTFEYFMSIKIYLLSPTGSLCHCDAAEEHPDWLEHCSVIGSQDICSPPPGSYPVTATNELFGDCIILMSWS